MKRNERIPLAALTGRSFIDFIHSAGLAVVHLSVWSEHRFNRYFLHGFHELHPGEVRFGWMEWYLAVLSRRTLGPFLHGASVEFEMRSGLGLFPPGYYLFRRGELLAWHPGIPETGDRSRLAIGGILGFAVASLRGDSGLLLRTLGQCAQIGPARRMIDFFGDALKHAGSRRARRARSWPGQRTRSELSRAYSRLGVPPTASDREVKDAWLRARKLHHPDLAADDPAEFARRNRISVELNRAYEVIREHRALA